MQLETLTLVRGERAPEEPTAHRVDELRGARGGPRRHRPVGAANQRRDRGAVGGRALRIEIRDRLVARDAHVRRLLRLGGVVEPCARGVVRERRQRRRLTREEIAERVEVLGVAHPTKRRRPHASRKLGARRSCGVVGAPGAGGGEQRGREQGVGREPGRHPWVLECVQAACVSEGAAGARCARPPAAAGSGRADSGASSGEPSD